MNLNDHIIIFSAFQAYQPRQVNDVFHAKAVAELQNHGVEFMELDGQYNSVSERSILVLAKHRAIVERLAAETRQECYLESHNDRHSELVYADGTRVAIGKLGPVNKELALTLDAWTYRADIDQYYAVGV